MEKFTAEIEGLLNHKLSLYREVNDLLRQERDYIVGIDVDSLWKSADKKKQLVEEIQAIREAILTAVRDQAGIQGLDEKTFSLSYLMRIIPLSSEAKKRLGQIKLAIDTEKEELKQSAKDNQRYVTEYLTVIDDIMSVAVAGNNQAQYGQTGRMPADRNPSGLIHAEV